MRVALYFHGGCLDRGGEATLRGTLALLEKTFPGLEATLYALFPEEDRAAGLPEWVRVAPLFPEKMPNVGKFSLDGLRLTLYQRTAREKADELFFGKMFGFSDIPEHDLFLCLGGGSYRGDSVSALCALNQKLAGAQKPAVLWGCSLEGKDLTPQKEADLRRYARVIARDSGTLALLQSLGLGDRAFMHPDPACLMEPEPCDLPEAFAPGETIGLQLGDDSAMKGVKALLGQLLAEPHATIALIPYMLRPGSDDRDVLRPLLAEFSGGRVFLLSEGKNESAKRLKYGVSRCRVFIGASSRACLAARSTGVPALDLGELTPGELTPDGLCARVTDFLEREGELRGALAAKLPEMKAEAEAAAGRLRF